MHKAFTVLTRLLMVAVVVQFFLAASGAFDTAPHDESFQTHRALGYAIILFALVLTIVAAAARLPGRIVGLTGLIAGLAAAQSVLHVLAEAFGDTSGRLVFGLHAVNGLAILAVVRTVMRQAGEPSSLTAPARPVS